MLPSKEGATAHRTRTPMQWANTKNAGFSNAPLASCICRSVIADRPTVAAQESDPDSLLNRVRALIRTRKSLPALQADGDFKSFTLKAGSCPLCTCGKKQGRS